MRTDRLVRQSEINQNRIQSFAFLVSLGICGLFSVCFWVSSVNGLRQSYEVELESLINPNNAVSASLTRLPGIGVVRAEAIIAYREDFDEKTGVGPAFRNCADLQKVKGIGPKTAQNMSKWLKFE